MNVHSMVPVEKISLEEIKYRLKQVLQRGKNNAQVSGKLADFIGLDSTSTNQPIRAAAKELLEEGVPVFSCVKGFYLAENPRERDDFVANLEMRIQGLRRDINAARRIKFTKEGMLF